MLCLFLFLFFVVVFLFGCLLFRGLIAKLCSCRPFFFFFFQRGRTSSQNQLDPVLKSAVFQPRNDLYFLPEDRFEFILFALFSQNWEKKKNKSTRISSFAILISIPILEEDTGIGKGLENCIF